MQNEMKDVLGQVSAEAAGRILDSANSKLLRAYSRLCPCSENEREHSEPDKRAQVPR